MLNDIGPCFISDKIIKSGPYNIDNLWLWCAGEEKNIFIVLLFYFFKTLIGAASFRDIYIYIYISLHTHMYGIYMYGIYMYDIYIQGCIRDMKKLLYIIYIYGNVYNIGKSYCLIFSE